MFRSKESNGAVTPGSHPRSTVVEQFVERHGTTLLAAARRFSASAADAEDAYQRAVEKLLTVGPDLPDDELVAWAVTVVRNECRMILRRDSKLADSDFSTLHERTESQAPQPEERLLDGEQMNVDVRALRALKPDQLRCLVLRADGLDYDEIRDVTGFSYAKVNRCLSEGRSALRERVQLLDSGAECRRFEHRLSLCADEALSGEPLRELQSHLSECVACRATLRSYVSAPSRIAALIPVGAPGAVLQDDPDGFIRSIADFANSTAQALHDRAVPVMASSGTDVLLAKKAAAIVAISATLVTGGAAVKHVVSERGQQAPDSGGQAVPDQTADPQSGTSPSGEGSGDGPSGSVNAEREPREARAADTFGRDSVAQGGDVGSAGEATGGSLDSAPDLEASPADGSVPQSEAPVDSLAGGDSSTDSAP